MANCQKVGIEGHEPSLMDSRGIEPRTTPMLREYYTTKPQARKGDPPGRNVISCRCLLKVWRAYFRLCALTDFSIVRCGIHSPGVLALCGMGPDLAGPHLLLNMLPISIRATPRLLEGWGLLAGQLGHDA
jgi:hypothetical protein